METLYDEKKRGKQEQFKSKILYKISYMLALLVYKAVDTVRIDFFNKLGQILKSGNAKNEMIYIIFQSIDGSQVNTSLNKDKFGFEKAVINVISIIQDKLEQHCRENSDKIEKSSSVKFLVLLFKPLEECLMAVGPMNQLLPEGYRKRIHAILNQLRNMFPMDREPQCNVPYSLLESFYNLNLIVDTDYVKTGKISFGNFYKLYSIVEWQLNKNEQNALIMAKLIILQTKTDVPKVDMNHFYNQFGKTVQKLLQIKEFYIFYNILTSFIEWAAQTELSDLNFMVPNDPAVQNLLQNIMQHNKIENISNYSFSKKMIGLNENYQHLCMKDKDIIKKFCGSKPLGKASNQPIESTNDISDQDMNTEKEKKIDLMSIDQTEATTPKISKPPQAQETSEQDLKMLNIAQKLIDIELMTRDDEEDEDDTKKYTPDQVKGIAAKLLQQFKAENPGSTAMKEFKAFVSKSKSTY